MTTRSVPAGRSRSACHTIAGSRPEMRRSVRAMSRSRLMPGKTTMAAFMAATVCSQALRLGRTRLWLRRRQRAHLDLQGGDEIGQRFLRKVAIRRFRLDTHDDRAGKDDGDLDVNRGGSLADLGLVEHGRKIFQH